MPLKLTAAVTDRHVTIKGRTVTVKGKLKKISQKEASVECSKKAGIGTRLELIFELPALGRFNSMSLYGHVKSLHNTTDGYYMTLTFEAPTPKDNEIIKDFVDYKKRLLKLGQKYKTHLQA